MEKDGECPYFDPKTKFGTNILTLAHDIANIIIEKNEGYGSAFVDGINKTKEKFASIPIDKEELYPYIHYLEIWQRFNDKLFRFFNLVFSKDNETKKRSMYDAILDITGYGLLSLEYLQNEEEE